MVLPLNAVEQSLGTALPHRRMEDWQWTDLRQLITTPYPPADATAIAPATVAALLAQSPLRSLGLPRLVFINGVYDAAHSTLPNMQAQSHFTSSDPLLALSNTSDAQGARLILQGENPKPIEVIFISAAHSPQHMATRNVIELAEGASATLVETLLGQGDYLSSSATDIRVGEGASLEHVKLQLESASAIHLAFSEVSLAANARYNAFTLTRGGRLNRQNSTILFNGEKAEAKIAGAYLLHNKQHADTRLIVDHKVPHCLSRELFKCVMDDAARGIFQGKVIVRPHAQKTDGKQSSHALLLSEQAEFDAKPELEIYADDVVCGHGATSGELNPDYLFYLESRGIPAAQAKAMLVAAFVGEAVETLAHAEIRDGLLSYLNHALLGSVA